MAQTQSEQDDHQDKLNAGRAETKNHSHVPADPSDVKSEPTADGPTTIDQADAVPDSPHSSDAKPAKSKPRRWRVWAIGGVVLVLAGVVGTPHIERALETVSTDDAYVNGHVTFVAPRVPGQVIRVLVDDNNRVRKGELLVELDKEPYQVQVNIAQAAVTAAQADLQAANAQVRSLEGETRRSAIQTAKCRRRRG